MSNFNEDNKVLMLGINRKRDIADIFEEQIDKIDTIMNNSKNQEESEYPTVMDNDKIGAIMDDNDILEADACANPDENPDEIVSMVSHTVWSPKEEAIDQDNKNQDKVQEDDSVADGSVSTLSHTIWSPKMDEFSKEDTATAIDEEPVESQFCTSMISHMVMSDNNKAESKLQEPREDSATLPISMVSHMVWSDMYPDYSVSHYGSSVEETTGSDFPISMVSHRVWNKTTKDTTENEEPKGEDFVSMVAHRVKIEEQNTEEEIMDQDEPQVITTNNGAEVFESSFNNDDVNTNQDKPIKDSKSLEAAIKESSPLLENENTSSDTTSYNRESYVIGTLNSEAVERCLESAQVNDQNDNEICSSSQIPDKHLEELSLALEEPPDKEEVKEVTDAPAPDSHLKELEEASDQTNSIPEQERSQEVDFFEEAQVCIDKHMSELESRNVEVDMPEKFDSAQADFDNDVAELEDNQEEKIDYQIDKSGKIENLNAVNEASELPHMEENENPSLIENFGIAYDAKKDEDDLNAFQNNVAAKHMDDIINMQNDTDINRLAYERSITISLDDGTKLEDEDILTEAAIADEACKPEEISEGPSNDENIVDKSTRSAPQNHLEEIVKNKATNEMDQVNGEEIVTICNRY